MGKVLILGNLPESVSDAVCDLGHTAVSAPDYRAAVALMAEHHPELVIARPSAASLLTREMNWAAPWSSLLLIAEAGKPAAELEGATLLEEPLDLATLHAWIETEMLVRQASKG